MRRSRNGPVRGQQSLLTRCERQESWNLAAGFEDRWRRGEPVSPHLQTRSLFSGGTEAQGQSRAERERRRGCLWGSVPGSVLHWL